MIAFAHADPITGERGPREVTDLIRHGGPHTMVAVTLAGAGRIDATDRHPFRVASRSKWVDAIDLKPGDVVLSERGDQIKVTNLKTSKQDLTAYNLTVADLHTYYVGQTSVLVHNTGPCDPPIPDGARVTSNEALEAGQSWLGKGYTEPVPGSGRYVSQDGTRVFRMGESDITGRHGGGPHVNFESLIPNPAKPGRMMVDRNYHIYLTD